MGTGRERADHALTAALTGRPRGRAGLLPAGGTLSAAGPRQGADQENGAQAIEVCSQRDEPNLPQH
jgi:hypothetical protein